MIGSIRLENFKGHRDTAIALEPLTVLVGPNGAGTTSVLRALEFLTSVPRLPDNHNLFNLMPAPVIGEVCRSGQNHVRLECKGGAPEWSLSVSFDRDMANLLWTAGIDARRGDAPIDAKSLAAKMGPAAFLRIDASKVAVPSSVRQSLATDGSGTPSLLANLKLTNDAAFEAITRDLRSVVPMFRALRINPMEMGAGNDFGYVLSFDFDGASNVPAREVSAGTLTVLALITVIHAQTHAKLLLIDDLETALHPKAQLELVALLNRLLGANRDLQIVATTHSPYVIDGVNASGVWVMATKEGAAVARRLTDHPDAKRRLEVLTAGELWSSEDESWVVEDAAKTPLQSSSSDPSMVASNSVDTERER